MALAQQVPNLGLARFSVQDKSILITGATGSLGRVAARALADAGARLTLAGGNSAGLAELVNGAGIDDAAVVTCRPDSLADAQQMVEAALGRYGRLDGVLVASGSNHVAPITEMAVEDFDAVMDANVRGAWLVCRAAGRVLLEQGQGGSVVLVSSVRGGLGNAAGYSAYCPSKAGTDLLAKTLAAEWGGHGIRVNALAPTGVSVRGDRVDVHRRSEGPGHPGGDARPDPVAPLRRTGRLRRRPDLSAQRRLELLHRPGDVSGRRVHRMLTSHGFSRAAVVGAGLMGRRIAGVLASAGLDVAITDTNAEILHAAAVEAARVAGAGRGSVAAAADLAAAIPDADLVIEAVVENLAVKQELFERLATLAPDAVLATNTSVLPIGAVTERVEDGSRVIGTHFWNPPDLIPVVEVVPSARTAPDTADRVVALLTQVGKLPVRVGRDVPGFIGNRLQHALWREAIALVAEGVCDPKTVDLVVRNTIGLRLATLGPLENADYIGLDLTLAIHDAVIPSLNHDPHPSPLLRELVAAGQLGARTGHGFLDWPAGAREATTARLAQHIAAQLQANEKGRGT